MKKPTPNSLLTLAVLATASLSSTGCNLFGPKSSKMDAGTRFTPSQAASPAVEPANNSPGGTDEAGHVAPPNSPQDVRGKTSEPVRSIQEEPAEKPEPRAKLESPKSHLVDTANNDRAPVTTPRQSTNTTGTYMTLGGVVAEVNEHPIYASQVLREIVRPLAARAAVLDEREFRIAAKKLIEDQLKTLTQNESVFAAAQRNLDEKDKDTARRIAARWRQQQITEAGGSLEQAKKKWAAEGYDFEERVEEEFRKTLTGFYYQKKIWPRVQVTADDMRRYYQRHLSDLFTDHEEIRFRAIKVDPKRTGSREKALEKAKDLYQRATRGDDFAEMAATTNDDPFLMKRQGDVGWVRKGDYKNEDVEKAVWPLQPGQVADIIDAGGAFYVAKLEERKPGRVRSFDDQAVQESIRENLRKEQFRQLSEKNMVELQKNSVVRTDDLMINTAVDMAMQNYPLWKSGAAAAAGQQPQSTGQ